MEWRKEKGLLFNFIILAAFLAQMQKRMKESKTTGIVFCN